MPRVRLPRPLAAIAFAAAVACTSNPLDLCACSLPGPHSLVYGRVTDPAGQAVPGATVHLSVASPDCAAVGHVASGPVDAAGRFRLMVFQTGAYAEQCIRLWASPPAGSTWRGSDTTVFAMPTPIKVPADSVRRDVALRAP